ncbi:leucyl-tRNA synthetase [Candidatus Phytoplasma luffae]|uniref:Leucine--tRNA ligase n=1 Tax=Loofah witches'-broom phytoplasma TaxID=35773 RepID=A0A975FJ39_LOWBP|nr:leucine--tRNA ligase [Candidatus Phytoplasma luffae]QTX02772.1 leucyl-tRNA synthetase [Candidatus Phytoplasma luffae]
MLNYDFKKIEKKWQKHWEDNKIFKTIFDFSKKKFYCLDMFPYPSSSGLHIGHIEGYTASDIVNRFKRMNGYNVFHPFGWDSFGLPAEQYALKTGNNPRYFTYENINNFKKQIKSLGKGIDWDTEIATSEPYFYSWTQWLFKRFYEKNMVFLKNTEVNFCEKLGTVLSNEEILTTEQGIFSEKGGFPVVRKKMKQWVFKITSYLDRLLKDLDSLDFPEQLKNIQKNWIGKQKGFIFSFSVLNNDKFIETFTTKPYTIFGVSAIILAPEHPLISSIVKEEFLIEVNLYLTKSQNKTDLERNINKTKTGVFTGNYVIHPFTKKTIPIWVSDYVLPHYGTSAVMFVPFCDERDFAFSQKYNLPIIPIFDNNIKNNEAKNKIDNFHSTRDKDILINSDFLNNLDIKQANDKIISFAEKNNLGRVCFTYKMRDWVFSRQRYWGEPFPVYYDENNNIYFNEDKELPIVLPFLDKIEIAGDGTSPLSRMTSWLYFEKDCKKYKRDSNTMPQLAGSSWYYIAYLLKKNSGIIPLNSKEAKKILDYFLPVDLYIGGKEHAVGHLLYSRFWHKFLYDLGLVSNLEPFKKIVHQGMILGEDNLKMSKSKGNGVSASLVLDKYGADVTRLYIMFLGPLEDDKVWSEKGFKGIQRFLNKLHNLFSLFLVDDKCELLEPILNETIIKTTEHYNKLKFNTIISQLMIFINQVYKIKKINSNQIRIFLQLLNPIAPHLTEEFNQKFLSNSEELVYSEWPRPTKISKFSGSHEKIIIIQINGKFKAKIKVDNDNNDKELISKIALKNEKISYLTKDKRILDIIYIKDKLLNLII